MEKKRKRGIKRLIKEGIELILLDDAFQHRRVKPDYSILLSDYENLRNIYKSKQSVGIGFDVHRLVPKRKLYLAGLKIKSKLGTLGHSDGDPVLHSVTDAILGACKMGDIGQMFSDKSKKFKN